MLLKYNISDDSVELSGVAERGMDHAIGRDLGNFLRCLNEMEAFATDFPCDLFTVTLALA